MGRTKFLFWSPCLWRHLSTNPSLSKSITDIRFSAFFSLLPPPLFRWPRLNLNWQLFYSAFKEMGAYFLRRISQLLLLNGVTSVIFSSKSSLLKCLVSLAFSCASFQKDGDLKCGQSCSHGLSSSLPMNQKKRRRRRETLGTRLECGLALSERH